MLSMFLLTTLLSTSGCIRNILSTRNSTTKYMEVAIQKMISWFEREDGRKERATRQDINVEPLQSENSSDNYN